jgi:hypothetical protein
MMGYRIAKVDRNQPEIVKALRKAGAVVHPTHQLGHGFPDVFCNYRGRIFGFEIKDPLQPASRRALTDDEKSFIENWNRCGETIFVIETAEQALKIMTERT